jgi:murein DD-endopeptidase MepM/ murein hydrolase activator NlpD
MTGGKVIYGHMSAVDSGIAVGTTVEPGSALGTIGNEGTSSGTHLHVEIREGPLWSGSSLRPPIHQGFYFRGTPLVNYRVD